MVTKVANHPQFLAGLTAKLSTVPLPSNVIPEPTQNRVNYLKSLGAQAMWVPSILWFSIGSTMEKIAGHLEIFRTKARFFALKYGNYFNC